MSFDWCLAGAGPGSAFADEGAQGDGIVALVGHQHRAGSEMANQVSSAGDVAGLPPSA